jgi:hypothetical protein
MGILPMHGLEAHATQHGLEGRATSGNYMIRLLFASAGREQSPAD